MKKIIVPILFIFTLFAYANSDEINLEVDMSNIEKSGELKSGEACDTDLEPAEVGATFQELPMAKTEPCRGVDCKNLAGANVQPDNYKNLPLAETSALCDD